MSDQIIYLNTRGPVRNFLLLIPLVLVLTGLWFAARWYIGDTIAENLDPDSRGLETAQMAARLAPRDPLVHWRLGDLQTRAWRPDQINQAIAEYEQATQLSPNDYRYWLSLGRALEQSGDTEKAETAMRRAVELAPAYAFPRWFLGNLLLRNGKEMPAFNELRRAGDAYADFRPQVFSLAWQLYAQSPNELTAAIGPTVSVRAEFARYLVDSGRLDDGLKVWNGLNANEKKESQSAGQAILKYLRDNRYFHRVLELWNDLAPEGTERQRMDQMVDPECEESKPADRGPFGWQVKSTRGAQVSFDAAKHHGGAHSVRILFQAPGKLDFNFAQLVIVQPGTQYALAYFLKTEQLASAGLPQLEIIDPADGAVLGAPQVAPSDSADWQQVTVNFKTGAKTEGVLIRIGRASCGDHPDCPIFGSVWYDDFSLKRL